VGGDLREVGLKEHIENAQGQEDNSKDMYLNEGEPNIFRELKQ
jgi:hypothetical protein